MSQDCAAGSGTEDLSVARASIKASIKAADLVANIATKGESGESSVPALIKAAEGNLFGGMPMLSLLFEARPGVKKVVEVVLIRTAKPLMFGIAAVSCFFVMVSDIER
jgi:hypothetical protein